MTSKIPKAAAVDIGVNLTHRTFRNSWKAVVQESIDSGVETLILTGTSLRSSQQSLQLAQTWRHERPSSKNLYTTVGIHPHDAKTFSEDTTLDQLEAFYQDHPDIVVAVGECGLDYNRMLSPKPVQLKVFELQVRLACRLSLPLFVHEREAHADLLEVLDRVRGEDSITLSPVVVHCFTGTLQEAQAYLERGFYIGFTGTICKHQRGQPLRDLLPTIPLERIMLETDAPFMGFTKGRRHSVPADTLGVARTVAQVYGMSFDSVCTTTTRTAKTFFGLCDDKIASNDLSNTTT